VTVYNDVGQLTSNNSREVTTYGGFPRKAPGVVVTPVDHTILNIYIFANLLAVFLKLEGP
jgi:hypothetical protein